MREYRKAKSMTRLAVALKVTIPTTYNYAKHYEVEPLKVFNSEETAMEIFNAYHGLVRPDDLASQFDTSVQMVRYYLEMAIHLQWNNDEKCDYPEPPTLKYIKIINELRANSKLFNKPEQLQITTGLTAEAVDKYLLMVFEYKTASKKKKK